MIVYIIDYIGIHCGMHYYLDAFKKLINTPNNNVVILSNYSNIDKPFLEHQYKGSYFNKIKSLIINYIRTNRFIKQNPDDMFIYLTYGNIIDLPFLYIVSRANNHMVDIHEAIAQNIDNKRWIKALLKSVYHTKVSSVITHSQRTNDFLDSWGYTRKRMFVPHFKYSFCKDYNINNLGDDVLKSIADSKINILFFGNITYEKGVDVLLSSVNKLDLQEVNKINVIIAGKDADGVYSTIKLKYPDNIKFLVRHINDDELVYLYKNVDYIAMPYRKTSQSGILEMAFYFKKPIIASRIPYFENMLACFPSFGILAQKHDEDSFVDALKIVLLKNKNDFFTDCEYAIYENRKEIDSFRSEFLKLLEH